MDTPGSLTRRSLLQGAGGLIVTFSLLGRASVTNALETTALKPVQEGLVASYLAIDAKGMVTVYSGKIDFGTGVRTGLAQIAAEELSVPLQNVTIIEGDTSLTPDQGPTYGSQSIELAGQYLRLAAATAREAIIKAAADRFGLAAETLTLADGSVSSGDQHVTYAELLADQQMNLTVNEQVRVKNPADYTIVGQSITRDGLPGKITGDFVYMQDFRVDGMVHARVVRPPAIGAALESVDEASLSHLPDLVKIVRKGNFLAVVAESEWSAIRGGREIVAKWSASETLPDQAKLWEHVRNTPVVKDDVTSDVGDVDAVFGQEGKQISATYDFALNTHGSIGPSCAIADFAGGKLVSWSSSQATHRLRKQFAQMFSIPEDDIRCLFLEGAGCYGRNGHEDAAADAALLSREVGRPVRVQWMRHDEHGWDPKGPPTLIDMKAHIDAAGKLAAWKSEFFIPQGAGGEVALLSANLADMPTIAELNPGGITNDSELFYLLPNIRTTCHRLETTPLRPSWIRAPGRMQNTFANESFLDEIAAELGVDPLAYRRSLIDPADSRGLDVLDHLKAMSKWEDRPSPRADRSGSVLTGRGVAYVKYELKRTYVGTVAEVEVDSNSGKIRATRFYVAHDCGQMINPAAVQAQIEGNIIQTTSRTLVEELTFDRSMVTSLDWATYPILRFPDVPEVIVDLINRPDQPPLGVGEPTSAIVSAAISNAVFDATGVRLRSVPFKPDKVRAAFAAMSS